MNGKFLKKLMFIFLSMSLFLLNCLVLGVYANSHSHTENCYNSSLKHLCLGNSKEGGNCFSLPSIHIHDLSCYNNQCNNTIAVWDVEISNDSDYCDSCGGKIIKRKFSCSLCGSSTNVNSCYNESCSHFKNSNSIMEQRNNTINHGTLPNAQIKEFGLLNCSIENGSIIEYHKTCGKENGKFYNEDGSLATPECGTVVVSWKPEIENQTEKNQSTKVVVTYMDGHTSIIPATYTTFDSIDKTSFVENHPFELYFQAKTSVGGGLTEQSVTAYYTNNVEQKDKVEEVLEKNKVEDNKLNETSNNIKQNENKDKEKEKKEENIITSTIDKTTTISNEKENLITNSNNNNEETNKDIKVEEDLDKTEEIEDIEAIDDENENNNKGVLLTTIVIVVLLVSVFVIVNVLISNKKE